MSIDPDVPPSGTGCADCEPAGGWWVHLRRCAQCGHIGCCDTSPAQHATAHFRESGHPVIQSYEPGEDWFWDYEKEKGALGPELAPPPRGQWIRSRQLAGTRSSGPGTAWSSGRTSGCRPTGAT